MNKREVMKVENLVRNYKMVYSNRQDEEEIKVLKGLDFTIEEQEFVGIMGKSGCGKTTLLKVLGLIDKPTSGKIFFTGKDASELWSDELADIRRREIGFVFQDFYLLNSLSVKENIMLPMVLDKAPVDKCYKNVEAYAENFGLSHLLEKQPYEVSGGEKQKIACASADAIHPDIFVLDEPSSNLDIATIEDLIGVIRHWQSEKKTVIVAEHRLYYLVPYADRILYMKHGSIVREFTGTEFQKLSPDELQGMGLRALDPFHLPPEAAPKPAAPKLHIKGFQFSYEKHGPLNVDIPDLTLPQGEIIGIIGNNGAGKSTFARCLCGLDKKAKGVLEMDGTPYDAKQRRHISYMVMQDVSYQLFADTLEKECVFGIRHPDLDAAKQAMERLGIYDYRTHHPNTLSGGQKQRAAVAVSMVCRKDILIFDEPTSGLDYDSMTQVVGLFQTLSQMGKVIFVVTHDHEFLAAACSRVIHLDNGKQQEDYPLSPDNLHRLQGFFLRSERRQSVEANGK